MAETRPQPKRAPGLDIILKDDPRIDSFRRDSVLTGNPDAVVRPRDWQDVEETVSWCNGNKIPVTVCGGRTSMSGASAAERGLLITTDRFNKVIDIGEKNGEPCAVVEPGLVVGDFQKIVEGRGWHYPVVPTSCDDAFVGGTVATNATGEDFYKYGPTRNFVLELSVIMADGTKKTLVRKNFPKISKGLGGYFLGGDEIDYFIGSEGTLGIISQIVFRLLPDIPKTFALLIPFRSNFDALSFISEINERTLCPRSLEYVDSRALSLMQTHKTCPKFSPDAKALVYLKDEGKVEKWLGQNLPDETIVATTDRQKADFHGWRRHIPDTISEIHEKLEKSGGGKVSGDWWVPRPRMMEMMKRFYEDSEKLGLDYLAYAHLGDGHPHAGYLCKNANEKKLAEETLKKHCRLAVSLGGGVAGEHGIGKIKRELLEIGHSKQAIEKMRTMKTKFDPNWILAPGNIFKNPDV